MNSGGLTGQTTIGAVDWNPIVCLGSAFSIPGLKSIGILLLTGVGITAYVRFHDKFSSKDYDERGFTRSKYGTYGTASWMKDKELKEILEIKPPSQADGIILGEKNGSVVCLPKDTRLNRHIAVFGASGTRKSRGVIRPALFTMAEIPEYVEKFTVHAYVPLTWKSVNLWAWSAPDGTNAFAAWPGQAMKEGEDGWFTAKAPTWVNSVIVNGNEGTVQTADISIDGKELWITVYEDLSYELSDTDPNKTAENITVRVQVPSDWSAPCCWAWSAPDGTNVFSSWPGEALTMDGDWYTIEVPGWINSVIINANEGSVQTADLSVEVGKDVWIVVSDAENATVSYEEPAGSKIVAAEKDNSVLIVCVALAVAAVAAVAVVVVVKKKKAK